MYKTGYVIENFETYIIDAALFDTGASSDNYISENFVNKYMTVFKPHIFQHDSTVRLGDSKTTVKITHVITLTISFLDNNSVTHESMLNFSIMSMKLDMIIGINSILFSFFELFLDMLKTAKALQLHHLHHNIAPIPPTTSTSNVLTESVLTLLSTGTSDSYTKPPYPTTDTKIPVDNPDYEHCVPSWSADIDYISPEELEIPDPCSFTGPLLTLDIDRSVQLETYYALLLTNINPDFVHACPAVMTFMRSDVALSVFCPEGWRGILGIDPLKLEVSPLCPTRSFNRPRPVRPIILDDAKKEFDRLCKYMYVPSTSSFASPLVIAPKPTPPYVRFCGDYVFLNTFITFMQCWIPIIMHELEKAARGKYFLDFDMKNAFHQIVLSKATSLLLTILTPWGAVRPLYMPEGISPATGILHTIMTEIFKDLLEWAIVIFDNFLVVTSDFQDCYNKLVTFVTRCSERRVVLGMAKSKLGYPEALFFGYVIKDGTYGLTDARKLAVTSLVMPTTIKQAQSLCGSCIFFAKNIINYSAIAAPMNDMCRKDFNFDPKTWTQDYVECFNKLKSAILASIAVSFPDYSLTFILRTDASDVAWGAVLLQVKEGGDYECIGLESAKWSDTASRWDIEKKEAMAIVLAFKKMSYILHGKFTIIETDNKNMLYLEKNETAIIKRGRIFIQGFPTCLRHLLAKFNKVSDWLSRQYESHLAFFDDTYVSTDNTYVSTDCTEIDSHTMSEPFFSAKIIESSVNTDIDEFFTAVLNILVPSSPMSIDEMFNSVHGGKNLHRGVAFTHKALNKKFPGHKIPVHIIQDKIESCSTCQKVLKGLNQTVPTEIRNLKPPHYRSRIGVDTLTVTPQDKFGNVCIIVCVEHFSKFATLYAAPDHSADHMARALFIHYVQYGKFVELISDPGSELMSATVVLLNQFLGQTKLVSIVDRHQSNGVEPTNKRILAHARTLVQDERIMHTWSDPIILGLISHAINSEVHSETGISPMEAKFGSSDKPWMTVADNDLLTDTSHVMLQGLNENIKTIRDISYTYQQQLVADRYDHSLTLNKYQPGDYVLFIIPLLHRPFKLHGLFLGPYTVVSHVTNTVTVRSLISGAISVFHSERLKPFYGTAEEAYQAALRDNEQYEIDHFIAYRGDPMIRRSMEFYILFTDGCYHWKGWSPDLFDTIQYEDYCRKVPQLFPLLHTLKVGLLLIRTMNSKAISTVQPLDTVYVDLRALGPGWYESLDLPNADFSVYVVPLTYTSWQDSTQKRLQCSIPSLDITWTGKNAVNNFFVFSYGSIKTFQPNMTLCTLEFIDEHNLIHRYNNN